MPIRVSCNSCGGVLHAPDDSAGKRGRCPTCGTILAIPADGPRVAADAPPPPGLGVPAPQPASAYGVAPPDPPAFPRPPAFGAPEAGKSSFNNMGRSSTAATGAASSRVPPANTRGESDAPATAPTDKTAKAWRRVHSGLGLVRRGLIVCMLGVLLPALLTILENNGVPLPQQAPGMLGAKDMPLASEIKAGTAVVLFILGGAMIVLGRLRIAGMPRTANSRGLATAAAFATVLAYIGFVIMTVLAVLAVMNDAVPKLIPYPDALDMQVNLQTRIERYIKHVFMISGETAGLVQRSAAMAFVAFGFLAEMWSLGVLGRLAVFLRHDAAAGRVTRLSLFLGLVVAAVGIGIFAYDFGGAHAMRQDVVPKWDALAPAVRNALRAGLIALAFLVVLFAKSRAVGGVRRAVADSLPS